LKIDQKDQRLVCKSKKKVGQNLMPGFFFRILYQTLVFLINFQAMRKMLMGVPPWVHFGCPVFFSESYTKRWSFWSIFKLCEKCSFWGTHWLPGFFFRILYQTLVFLINFYCKIVIFDQKTNVWYENVKKTCIFHIWHTFCAKHRILMTSLKIDQKDQRLVWNPEKKTGHQQISGKLFIVALIVGMVF